MSCLLKSSTLGFAALAVIALAVATHPGYSLQNNAVAQPAEQPSAAEKGDAPTWTELRNFTFDMSPRNPSERRIESVLVDPAGVDIEFIDQPLKEAMDYIGDAHGIQIILDEMALQDDGIATDEPINRVLSGVSLHSALNIILEPLGLTYIIEDEVLKITTLVVEEEHLVTRVYDVRPLHRAGMSPGNVSLAIRVNIKSWTWRADDATTQSGDPGRQLNPTITELGSALVVTHTQDMHRRVVDLLDQLARFAAQPGQKP